MDRGAWWATAHGLSKHETQLRIISVFKKKKKTNGMKMFRSELFMIEKCLRK